MAVTIIKIRCPNGCGPVALASGEITLVIDHDHTGGQMRAVCPAGLHPIRRRIDRIELHALQVYGAIDDIRTSLPPHPEQPPRVGPLTHDDLLDAHLLLAGNDWSRHLTEAAS